MNNTGNWLHSFTVMRDSDYLLCHVWMDGGSICPTYVEKPFAIPVPQRRGGSHRSVLDYEVAALNHLEEAHPKEFAEQKEIAK